MDKNIVEVLNKIEEAGFESYIVGGFVRDYIRGINTTDVDICTNALPKDLIEIFGNSGNPRNGEYGAYKIVTSNFNFDITTYRKELKYDNRRPTEIEYVNNLLEDIKRRDFTINSLCMNKEGTIIDLLNAKEDINNKIIKVIGDIKTKFIEDPLRILRAIRFSIVLDFHLDDEIIDFIKNNKELLNSLSKTRIKYELDCILVSPNAIKGLNLLKELNLLDVLKINFNEIVYVDDILGMWSQIEIDIPNFFTKEELRIINNIKKILETKNIDNIILFDYDLYSVLVAGSILGYDKTTVNELHQNLPIQNMKDIDITTNDILSILNIKPSNILKSILSDIKSAILNNELVNDQEQIIIYLNNNKDRWV